MKNKTVCICMLILFAMVLPVAGSMNFAKNYVEQSIVDDAVFSETDIIVDEEISGVVSDGDWWPMFRHDIIHTGYSTSSAPNTNNVLWSYTTDDVVCSSPSVVDGKVYVGSYVI